MVSILYNWLNCWRALSFVLLVLLIPAPSQVILGVTPTFLFNFITILMKTEIKQNQPAVSLKMTGKKDEMVAENKRCKSKCCQSLKKIPFWSLVEYSQSEESSKIKCFYSQWNALKQVKNHWLLHDHSATKIRRSRFICNVPSTYNSKNISRVFIGAKLIDAESHNIEAKLLMLSPE